MPRGKPRLTRDGQPWGEMVAARTAKMQSLAREGLNYRAIAKAVGCSMSLVANTLQAHPVAVAASAPAVPPVEGVAFKPIAGFPGYVVGDDGSVWSSHRRSSHRPPGWYPVRVRSPDDFSRYCRVNIRAEGGKGRPKVHYLHHLVLNAFVGPCPDGMECRHHDGKTTNNRLSNLSWGTKSENAEDRRRHGTMPLGSRHPNAKLDELKVRQVKKLLAAGWTHQSIADRFGVTPSIIGRIARGKGWVHVSDALVPLVRAGWFGRVVRDGRES